MNLWQRKIDTMLPKLNGLCRECMLCKIGRDKVDDTYNPHVMSNMNPTRYMVVGQNPGFNEIKQVEPFVGQAGSTFNKEIAKQWIVKR